MKKLLPSACLLLLLGLSGCQDEPIPMKERSTRQAFDLNGFLDQEVQNLTQAKAAVTKTVSEDGQNKETKTLNHLNWAEELGAFADADINKPALLGLFDEEQTTNAAGQTVKRYRAKDDADANVREVAYTFNAQNQLVQVEATIVQENMLFNTRKQLHLALAPDRLPRLQRYRLEETQKLLLMGEERYGITGQVVQP